MNKKSITTNLRHRFCDKLDWMRAQLCSAEMAKLHMFTPWSSDAGLFRLRLDTKIALPLPSSSSSSRAFPPLSSVSSADKAWHISSTRRKRVCSIAALSLTPDFYHIPYTEGVPVGSKLKLFNLPYNCDQNALIKHFRSCHAVVESLEITNNSEEEGNASGYAILQNLDQACAAVAQLDGARFEGKCVRMDFVERRPYERRNPNNTRSRKRSAQPANQVYIGNLPWRVDSTTLEQLFSVHGTVHEAQVMRDRSNGRSRGFGFVVMSSAVEVKKAIAALDGCEIEGRPLKVNVAMTRAPLPVNV